MTMKNIIKTAVLAGVVFGTCACTDKYEEYNKNPYDANHTQVEYDGYNVGASIKAMEGYIIPVETNLNQFTECLLGGSFGGYLADSNKGFVGKNFATYNPQEHWIQVAFNDIIPNTYSSYLQLKELTDDPVIISVADIVRIAAMHRVSDMYGPIPYTKIGEDAKLTAPYDDVKTVYHTMIGELDTAIAALTENRTANFSADIDNVFAGNVEEWVKYANSLKLRLAMRLAYCEPDYAKTKAEEVMAHEIGPMTSNSDNAYNIVSKSPFRVVMYDYNGGDSRVSADLTSYMQGYNDPRCPKYFTKTTFEIDGFEEGYYGLRTGIDFSSSANAHKYSNMNIAAEYDKVLLMNAAETAFLRAEGALRGWNMGGTAESLYEEGVRLSFGQWGASGADAYLADDLSKPQKYDDPLEENSYTGDVSQITIKWDETADMETKLERIITQKWIANFPLGNEAWADFRRTGYPKLMTIGHNLSSGVIADDGFARRLPYPQREYTENNTNLQEALQMLGGPDNMATRIWWDCK